MHLLLANMLLPCGWLDTCLLSPGHPAGQRNDWEEGSTALGHHLIDFWTNICLCQSLIIEKNPEGPDSLPHVYQVRCCCRESYWHGKHDFTLSLISLASNLPPLLAALQGPSPDEIALVDAARQMGFEFKQRTQVR